jgi:hypothetical protein
MKISPFSCDIKQCGTVFYSYSQQPFLKHTAMRNDSIKKLVELTFSKLNCPAKGNGMYAEIEKALLEAYNIGKAQQESHHMLRPNEEVPFQFIRA